jgi:hypothetical protein
LAKQETTIRINTWAQENECDFDGDFVAQVCVVGTVGYTAEGDGEHLNAEKEE